MELLEALLTVGAGVLEFADACACFVQIVAAVFDVAGAWSGVRAAKEVKKRREMKKAGAPVEGRNRPLGVFLILLPAALVATALAVWTLVRAWR